MWKCFDCGKIWWDEEKPRTCENCGKDNIMSYYEYYMEEPYDEEPYEEEEEEEEESEEEENE